MGGNRIVASTIFVLQLVVIKAKVSNGFVSYTTQATNEGRSGGGG